MYLRLVLLPVLALLSLAGCEAERTVDQKSNTYSFDPRAEEWLDSIQSYIDDYRLEDALRESRRMHHYVEQRRDSLPSAQHARLYQYLSELHSRRWMYFDSVDYYTESAQELIPDDAPTLLRVRQWYVEALGRSNYDRSWVDIMMTADLGLETLRREELADDPLYPKLLLVKAYASRKYGDLQPNKVDRQTWYGRAETLTRQAVKELTGRYRGWERYAQSQLGLLLARFPDRESEVRAISRTLGALDTAAVSEDSLFLLTFLHSPAANNNPDSVYQYGWPLVERGPHFYFRYDTDTYYYLGLAAMRKGDYVRALETSFRDQALAGCCLYPNRASREKTGGCRDYGGCAVYATEHVRILMARYLDQGDLADLAESFRLSQSALWRYEQTLSNPQEESTLNIMGIIGQRMLDVILSTAVAAARRDPSPAHLNVVLQTMERGKSLLLRQELLDVEAVESGLLPPSLEDSLRRYERKIVSLQQEYVGRTQAYPHLLHQYQTLSAVHRRKLAGVRKQLQPEFNGTETLYAPLDSQISLRHLRAGLDEEAAVLEFGETGDSIFALYVDIDTTLLYGIDREWVTAGADSLYTLLSDLRYAPERAEHYHRLGYDMYLRLLGPVSDRLSRRGHLMVAASPSLRQLPLSALPTAPPGGDTVRYVLDDLAVQYVPSWETARRFDRRKGVRISGAQPKVASWAHPELDSYFSKLYDVLSIRTSLAQLTGSVSLPAAREYDWLQFSVHSQGDPEQLHANYLYFSRTDSVNGMAIAQLRLRASLVVLAACSTSRGRATAGEGTFSLQRSFHLAGVPDVVASLYDISAPATASLLTRFYEHLLAGEEPEVALTRAQRAMRNGELGGRYRWVGYWGGMVVG